MAIKSSHDTLDTFKDILKDIDEVSEVNTGNKIPTNIKTTMSDRAVTETKFNNHLATYRELPEVMENYNQLCEDEKQSNVYLHTKNFCHLYD